MLQVVTVHGTWSGTIISGTPRMLTLRDRDGRTVRIETDSIIDTFPVGRVR